MGQWFRGQWFRFLVAVSASVSLFSAVSAEESEALLFLQGSELDAYWILVHREAPNYPRRSLQKHETGCVAVGFFIEADGTTSNHRVVAGVQSKNLQRAAIAAAKQFVYVPGAANADRASVITTNSFTFTITDNRPTEADRERTDAMKARCDRAAREALLGKGGGETAG